MSKKKPPLKVMISSSVYGAQDLLRQIDASLRSYGYQVICSPMGSVAANPALSNLDNCLNAVAECDVFIGFIRPLYGSGKDSSDDMSITHMELEKAIELKKPRWMLAHSSVVSMRKLLKSVFFDDKGKRNAVAFKPVKGFFDDLRVIEMYERAADSNNPVVWSKRTNHWVQEYHYDSEALSYINEQFNDIKRVADYFKPAGK